MATSTRYLGFCPVCQGDFKVRGGALVHHGYRRPGIGYIVGDCPGVGFPPFETSTAACEAYLKSHVLPAIRSAENRIGLLTRPDGPPRLTFDHYDLAQRRVLRAPHSRIPETIQLTRSEADALAAQLPSWDRHRYSWEERLREAIETTEKQLRFWESERARMDGLVASWQPRPLRTVEEEVAKATEARTEREQRKTAERELLMAEALVSLQQRIDSAVTHRRPETLESLFSDGYRKLETLSRYELKRNDVLRLLDRDHVWRAFGLIRPDGTYLGDWKEISAAFEPWSHYHQGTPRAFPVELGGGKAKLRR